LSYTPANGDGEARRLTVERQVLLGEILEYNE